MEELMVANPEDTKPKRHSRRTKALQIISPESVRRARRKVHRKAVAGALGDAAAKIAILKAIGLKDWGM